VPDWQKPNLSTRILTIFEKFFTFRFNFQPHQEPDASGRSAPSLHKSNLAGASFFNRLAFFRKTLSDNAAVGTG